MNRYIIILLAALAVLSASCKKAPEVRFESDTITVPAAGGPVEISMSTNYDWSAAASVSWISVVSKSGESGNGMLSLKIASSKLAEERIGEVVIMCESLTKTLTVIQSPKPQIVVDGESSLILTSEAQTFEVSLGANVGFEVSTDVDWMRRVSSKALVSSSFTFETDANELTSARFGNIIFSDRESGARTVYEVTQSGRQQTFILVHNSGEISAPALFGFGLSALVDWGDGSFEKYSSSLKHTYSGSSERTLTVTATSASTVSVTGLVGVKSIDVTEF